QHQKKFRPFYVYNLKKIGLHKNTKFSKNKFVKYYKKGNYFKVLGYSKSKTGLLRYHVKSNNSKGYITANDSYVRKLYYTKIKLGSSNVIALKKMLI
ncbi:DUF5776 domain-containing protein, partial [Apilactobacillus ozensis]|uniref:DUF5776 domain-containing protein n=1 Tax=Apilactobacillus ozensis TaxID=866801 RepID=UPI000AD23169